MAIIFYHSTLISEVASPQEAVDKTSSQIFLSRGVADPCSSSVTPVLSNSWTSVTSVFTSASRRVMTLGDASTRADCSTMSDLQETAPADYCPSDVKIATSLASGQCIADPESTLLPRSHGTIRAVQDKRDDNNRGRTLTREQRLPNPLEFAESRNRRSNTATIEVATQPLGKRISRSSTFYEDPSDPCAALEDNLLEPFPSDTVSNNLSEVLNTPVSGGSFSVRNSRINSGTLDIPTRRFSFSGHLPMTGITADCSKKSGFDCIAPLITDVNGLESIYNGLSLPYLLEYLKIPSKPQKVHVPQSLAMHLPTEILHQIFYRLAPVEFNSARHTCRTWLINSLERSLLETMFRRGGFSSSILHNATANHIFDVPVKINDEWLMSKLLARECALGPGFIENGFSKSNNPTINSTNANFVDVSTLDFTELSVHYPGIGCGTVFTVSNCGKFLMAANGCMVYIYELNRAVVPAEGPSPFNPGSLRPVTSIICPHRVLACSMDTSSHRYAIATLLEGRIGLVCDITALNQAPRSTRSSQERIIDDRNSNDYPSFSNLQQHEPISGPSLLDRVSLKSSASNHGPDGLLNDPPFVFPGIATAGSTFNPVNFAAWEELFNGNTPSYIRTAGSSPHNSALLQANVFTSGGASIDGGPWEASMPVETGSRSLYQNLCSEDDPPRSVAICPQRRCVAFGCSSGIELHWVDALTGQDLNRWFPLTAPSDYLFFLPPRRSVDSAKKLRLISSAARPSERPAIVERAFGNRSRNSPFWERTGRAANAFQGSETMGSGRLMGVRGGDSVSRYLTARNDFSDHYHAVPLSDGYHILFTDPSTGLLCLGNDAPIGGPTKLLRKIWFEGPQGLGSPVAYAGGSYLKWGIRVVAAYGSGHAQSIWLFSVPSDIFKADQNNINRPAPPVWTSSSSAVDNQNWDWLDWFPADGLQEWLNQSLDSTPGLNPRSVWPVKIRGQKIGACPGVIDVAIDSGPDMIVWAFSKIGIVKVWKLNIGRQENPRYQMVVRDGTIRGVDKDNDIEMIETLTEAIFEAPSDSPETQHPTNFDGTKDLADTEDTEMPDAPPLVPETESTSNPSYFNSLFSATTTSTTSRRHGIERSQYSVTHDSQGDVIMEDLNELNEMSEESFEHASFTEVRGEIWYESFWSRASATDLVEALTGIARIDIEIR